MKPVVFDYHTPDTLKESLILLDRYGFDAKVLSGGQSLVPMMNMRLARPEVLIDINGVKELNYIKLSEDYLTIGGLTRHFQVEHHKEIENIFPMLAEGMKMIGHTQIRSRGTIGGSIVHADPTAELPVILTALGGTVTLASTEEERTLSTDEFFLTYLTTTIEPNEVLVSVNIPRPRHGTGQAIEEFAMRSGDFAIVLAAATVRLNRDGTVDDATLVLGGVDGVPVVLDEVTDELCGKKPNSDVINSCTEKITDLIDPEADIHASVEYRKDLGVTLSNRVLERAAERAANIRNH
jgi:carbon-monoxide dehydrogenase medium subunit